MITQSRGDAERGQDLCASASQRETRRRSPDARMKAKCVLLIKSGAISQEEFYQRASTAVGRYLVPGFGLSTCDHRELIQILDAVTAKTPRPPRPNAMRHAPRAMRRDGDRRASLAQYRLMENLKLELKLSEAEFRGIAVQAVQKEHSSSARDIGRIIEALKAIKARRLKSHHQDTKAPPNAYGL